VGKDVAAFSTQEIVKQIAVGNYAQQINYRCFRSGHDGTLHRAGDPSVDVGEYPYAAVICRDGEIVSEGINSARRIATSRTTPKSWS
jgi:hypothetical protein